MSDHGPFGKHDPAAGRLGNAGRAEGLDPFTALALHRARTVRGWSYRQAARRLGVSAGHLHHLDHGHRLPSATVARALIDGYRLTADVAAALLAQAVPDAGRDSPPYRAGHGSRPRRPRSWETPDRLRPR